MPRLAIPGQRVPHFSGEIAALPRKGRVLEFRMDLPQLLQRRHREKVRGDQEGENAGIVRRTESGMDKPARTPRVSVAIVRQRIGRYRRATLELVGTAVL